MPISVEGRYCRLHYLAYAHVRHGYFQALKDVSCTQFKLERCGFVWVRSGTGNNVATSLFQSSFVVDLSKILEKNA